MIHNDIDRFVGHFREQLEVAAQLSSDALSRDPNKALRVARHRKILYCAMLDSLAKVRYENLRLGNRQRFVRLLRNHTAWPDGHLISVPILHQRLDHAAPAALRVYLQAKLDLGDPDAGNGEPLSAFDEPLRDLLDLAGCDKAAREKVCQAQHFELVYRYRNFVVHEFREPGDSMEFFGEGERDPLYHCYLNDSTWTLLYPADFFHRLVEAALSSLQAWFAHDRVDPYDAVSDSSDW